jgi:quercetin dioxygenase-like cupin family protein
MSDGEPIVVEGLGGLDLPESQPSVYDQPIGLRLLYLDPESGAEHYLVRYPAGLGARRHRHTVAHTIVVLEGEMEVNGRVVGAGTFGHFPAGEAMHHSSTSNGSCLFVIIFHGPFDVEIVED